ncbi:hypothetical protein N7448_011306 [Penicillium atrosanguineum]|nr:hypothetical protein N7448_011306 [Penicillium atrosanguineum]
MLKFETPQPTEGKRRNWKEMDGDTFLAFVTSNSRNKLWLHLRGEVQHRQTDDAVEYLTEVIPRGVQESTPWARPSSRENPSFTFGCRENEDGSQEYTSARNCEGKVIAKASRTAYCEDMAEEGPKSIGTLRPDDILADTSHAKVNESKGAFLSAPDLDDTQRDRLKGLFMDTSLYCYEATLP